MSPSIRNVFIECTAVDLTKANITLNTIVAMFSRYCKVPFSVEPVRAPSPLGQSGHARVCPGDGCGVRPIRAWARALAARPVRACARVSGRWVWRASDSGMPSPLGQSGHARVCPGMRACVRACARASGHARHLRAPCARARARAPDETLEPIASPSQVTVQYPPGPSHPKLAGRAIQYPDLSPGLIHADVGYIQRAIGLPPSELPPARICELLGRMMLPATAVPPPAVAPAHGGAGAQGVVAVTVPVTRSDILHACDVMEDVAIAYSMNKARATRRPHHTPRVAARRASSRAKRLLKARHHRARRARGRRMRARARVAPRADRRRDALFPLPSRTRRPRAGRAL